jgi:hypothetical protein
MTRVVARGAGRLRAGLLESGRGACRDLPREIGNDFEEVSLRAFRERVLVMFRLLLGSPAGEVAAWVGDDEGFG